MEDPRYKEDLMPGKMVMTVKAPNGRRKCRLVVICGNHAGGRDQEESLQLPVDQMQCQSELRPNARLRMTGKELCSTSRQPFSTPTAHPGRQGQAAEYPTDETTGCAGTPGTLQGG